MSNEEGRKETPQKAPRKADRAPNARTPHAGTPVKTAPGAHAVQRRAPLHGSSFCGKLGFRPGRDFPGFGEETR